MLGYKLLDDRLITTATAAGEKTRRSLPETLAALVRGEIADFPRLRPHQRHVWHALLVQLALLALTRPATGAAGGAGEDHDLPDDAASWRRRLLALTPDDADGAAWALRSPPERPAFLQAPVPGGDIGGFKSVAQPDELDLLILAKNHDVKRHSLPPDDAELWLYALVSLQTQQGYSGSYNYGIARMNRGHASRPALSALRLGDAAASLRFIDDYRRTLARRDALVQAHEYPAQGGIALLWLPPWDGKTSVPLSACDPFFIEICRRVRLIATGAGLAARTAPSKAPRIEAKAAKGNTGDPWTPLIVSTEIKAFTADERGWSYAQLVKLLFPRADGKGERVIPAPLQVVDGLDLTADLAILGRVLARDQGKTEGYFERLVPVTALVPAGFGTTKPADRLADMAHGRVKDAGTFARHVLFPAVMAVCAGAPRTRPGERARDDTTTKARASRLSARFDTLVDRDFFDDLAAEAAVIADPEQAGRVRAAWIRDRLFPLGQMVVQAALAAAPAADARHWRVRVQALELFTRCFYKQFSAQLQAATLPMPVLHLPDEADLSEEPTNV